MNPDTTTVAASSSSSSSDPPPAPTARLDRHPSLVPLLNSLNGYYTPAEDDEPGHLSQAYHDLRTAWWPLARAKYLAQQQQQPPPPSSSSPTTVRECRVWADFFTRHIRADVRDVLCHGIFAPDLAVVRNRAATGGDLRQRFERVATLLGRSPYEAFVWLGTVVAAKSNSLKTLSALLAPTGRYRVRPAALFDELHAEMLRRHADVPETPPELSSLDVTNVFRRYHPGPSSSRVGSAVPSSRASSVAPTPVHVPVLAPIAGTKRPAAEQAEAEDEAEADKEEEGGPASAKRARLLLLGSLNSSFDSPEVARGSVSALSPGFGQISPLVITGQLGGGGDDDDDDNDNDEGDAGNTSGRGGREARMALLRSVLEFHQPTVDEVGGQTAGFWGVFRGFAEQLMRAEERM
ncbi:hypothetical protein F4782DRAFT_535107 [Xylaria castorea]|nr:hypothetical protein F4782DRAFT_535107 [Xylaria castorea]